MPAATGFFEQKSGSPMGLATVVLLHGAVFAALVLIKGPEIMRRVFPHTTVTLIPVPPEPTPNPPPDTHPRVPRHETVIDHVTPIVPTTPTGPAIDQTEHPPQVVDTTPPGRETVIARVELPPPVRRDAELLGSDLQPPYPPSEERAQRGGLVRIRVTIGANGRVTGVERLFATSDAFWNATQRQALNRWRFRPATIDGRPTEATKVMTVHFRIEDI